MKKYIEYKLSAVKVAEPPAPIINSADAAKCFRNFYMDDILIYESMWVIACNKRNRPIGFYNLSRGGITGTIADPVMIAKFAIDCMAKGIVLCHNHPSGNLRPSSADIAITRKVKTILELLDIALLDHIIITDEGHYSFADAGDI